MKYPIWLFVWFLCVQTLSAQSPRLPWVDGELPPEDPAFDYRIARGEGSSLRDARSDAFNTLLVDLGNQAGVSVTSRTLSEIRRDLNYRNNSAGYDEGETSTTLYRIDREEFKAAFVKVGEYYERVHTASGETYRVWELYEVSGGKRFQPYIPEYTSRYGAAGFLRSMLLPGWGQLYKGSRAKGLCIIAGEAVLAGGIVTAENLRASYLKKIRETHTAAHIKTYADRADTVENVRNLCIAGAAALYLYSLIDALAAPGDMRLIAKERPFALYPVAGDRYMGFGLAINF